ncbi:hypothetical protein [Noviherbaspirillum sp.]|uniref:hypothetical protein n=1 Tax=Noviherbaspirillum sp. TaxID=1926288 RepID=UPI002B480EED|nr:hypothetical protein [Noviherbaspirillum sp.]HJV79385.1 hypothetical protein [Noviherbaspirillum sp.]
MSNLKRSSEEDEKRQSQEPTSSHGNNSKSVTPKDVSPQDASAKDVTERKTCSDDPEEREQEMLDDAVDMTFPASDPIAIPSPDKEREKRIAQRNNP